MLLTVNIEQSALQIHKLTITELKKENRINQSDAWVQIYNFIKPTQSNQIVYLIAHNERRFDFKIIQFYLKQIVTDWNEQMEKFMMVDSLDYFNLYKSQLPFGPKSKTGRQRLIRAKEQIYMHLFKTKCKYYHEALYDTLYLLRILMYFAESKDNLMKTILSIKRLPLFPLELKENTSIIETAPVKQPRRCKTCGNPMKGHSTSACNSQNVNTTTSVKIKRKNVSSDENKTSEEERAMKRRRK